MSRIEAKKRQPSKVGINPSKTQLQSLEKKIQDVLPVGVGAFLFVQHSESLPLTEIWRGEDTDYALSGDSKRLLGVCTKRQRSVLIHDAEKDILMKGIKIRTFSSALCAPILDEDGRFIGALLLLSDKTDTFSKEYRYTVERTSRELAQTLVASRRVPEQEAVEEQHDRFFFLASKPFLLSLGCTFLFFAVWLAAPKPKPKESRPVNVVEPVRNEALEMAQGFLGKLRAKNYDGAWSAMSAELRSRWSRADFAAQMKQWVGVGPHQEILENREISKIQRHLENAQVTLLEVDLVGDKGAWDWQFTKRRGDWELTSLKGPINSPNLLSPKP